MDMYEALVEAYVTIIEGCAVIPQIPILKNRKGEAWEAYPDFLALDFKKREAQIIEVTKSGDASGLIQKRNGQRDEIESYVKNHSLDEQIGFPIRWRFFIRGGKTQTKAARRLRELGFDAEIVTLE